MNYLGFIIGLLAFLTIGVFHPIVARMEYHLGKKSWWILVVPGAILTLFSIFTSDLLSIFLGVLGFSCFWSTYELFKQHTRVLKGQAKRNPNRNDYE